MRAGLEADRLPRACSDMFRGGGTRLQTPRLSSLYLSFWWWTLPSDFGMGQEAQPAEGKASYRAANLKQDKNHFAYAQRQHRHGSPMAPHRIGICGPSMRRHHDRLISHERSACSPGSVDYLANFISGNELWHVF